MEGERERKKGKKKNSSLTTSCYVCCLLVHLCTTEGVVPKEAMGSLELE